MIDNAIETMFLVGTKVSILIALVLVVWSMSLIIKK